MFGVLAYDPMTGLAITTADEPSADAATPPPNATMRALQRLTGKYATGYPTFGSMGRPEEDR